MIHNVSRILLGWPQMAIICILYSFAKFTVSQKTEEVPPLLIITFSGFRWDYLNRTITPNFDDFMKSGVYATEGLQPVFPTSTLTNHWSIVTGLYAESHGIIDDKFYDPIGTDSNINKTAIPVYQNKTVRHGNLLYDTGVEPIWISNSLQNPLGRTGSIMWWGAENSINGIKPYYHMPYGSDVDDKSKIDKIIELLTTHSDAINLGLLCFLEPDQTAHVYGPDSNEVTAMIEKADKLMGYFMEEMYRVGLLDNINIIVTSDHGFSSNSKDNLIYLDDFVDPRDYDIVHHNPVASIIPHEGKEEEIYKQLHHASESRPFSVYKREDIPQRLHYRNNDRVTPIIAMADLTYSFITNMSVDDFNSGGSSGYDNKYAEMRPFFMASGPDFKQNYSVKSFQLVDLYPLMCLLLELKPADNNGSLDIVSNLLAEYTEPSNDSSVLYIRILATTSCISLLLFVCILRRRRYLRSRFKQWIPSSWQEQGVQTIAWPVVSPRTTTSRPHSTQMPLMMDFTDSDDEF